MSHCSYYRWEPYGSLHSSALSLWATICRWKDPLNAKQPVPILQRWRAQSHDLYCQTLSTDAAQTDLLWLYSAWGVEVKKRIILTLSHAQGTVESGHWVSALFTQIPVNEKSELTGEYFLINCTISSGSTQANTKALIDTDSSDYAFIDQVYTQSLNLTSILLNTPYALHVFNGCESASDLITHYVLLNLFTGNYVSHNTLCYVT